MSDIEQKLDEYINQAVDIHQNSKGYDSYYEWAYAVTRFLELNFENDCTRNFGHMNHLKTRYREYLKKKLIVLKDIRQNFDYYVNKPKTVVNFTTNQINVNKIFIVHGRDEGAKNAVENFLRCLDLDPIVLHRKANQGKTIIEKIEAHSDVGYAVVLLTPDDEGKLKGEEKLEDRARQNVIFELGYFIGKLGRKNVCGLCKEDFKLPSDYDGVVYIPMDKNDGWHKKLAMEINASGVEFDTKKLLEI